MTSAPERADEPSYGRYEPLFRIAAGGMAEVHAARVQGEAGFQKLVALKRMLPHLCDDERFVTMFLDEGRLAANISSPHVVSTLDLGRASDDSLYLVMELVVGATLHALARSAIKTPERVPVSIGVELIAQAARGLDDAHEARTPAGAPLGIVHRDVSPQNILVGVDGRVRITDFGVARAMMRATKTTTGELKGKFGYFSPEQCVDRGIDRRSDVFSLGIVAWEILVGRRLFHANNPLAILERVTKGPIPDVHETRPEVSPAIAAVIARALERDPSRRWETAGEFESALRAASGPVAPSVVGAFVRAHGGESLARMEDGIRSSFVSPSAPRPRRASEMPIEVEVPSRVVARPAAAPLATIGESWEGQHSAATIDLVRATSAPGSTVETSGIRRAWVAVAVVVVLVAAGSAAWVARGALGGAGITATPLSTNDVAGAHEPAREPEVSDVVAPLAVEPTSDLVEPQVHEAPATAEDTAPRATRARPRTRRAAPETSSTDARASETTVPTPRVEPVRTEPVARPEPSARTVRTEPEESAPVRRSPLLGVDQFERELGSE